MKSGNTDFQLLLPINSFVLCLYFSKLFFKIAVYSKTINILLSAITESSDTNLLISKVTSE